ncbi:secreted RxLR effector protein 78-like [Lycium ferocissimum]|uniref:secreted RxLR effector protein 78-like n=1 Tax=Lycium ferocissimum TaxID=112874 RepID=UPI0028167676|nr:secreted RxLR effector protein 78-like [Lycium ferocissimum]
MRPISLSNFINKVISRVVQNKLENVFPSLISANQSGFVKGRCIIENVLLTQEVVSDIRLRGKPANVVLKLDMAKAYDRVSWDFLARVLRKMGFAEVFIDMIWRLIANNWYSVLFNGQASGFFHSTRGVKQGDPLSPALFILFAEVLSRALNSLFEDNGFRSYGMPKWSANLNHLAYADDTIT